MENTFASRVRQFRKFKNLSQKAFAEQCGLEQGNITQMEGGTDPKSSNSAKILAGFPDLSAEWLLIDNWPGPMLKDGKVLTPVVLKDSTPAIQQPTEGLTSGAATVAEAENILLRQLLASKDTVIEMLKAELGKSPDSPDAADAAKPQPNGPLPMLSVQSRIPRRRIGFRFGK